MLVVRSHLFDDQAGKHWCSANLFNLTVSLKNRYYFRSLYSQSRETGPFLALAIVFSHCFCRVSEHFKHSMLVR